MCFNPRPRARATLIIHESLSPTNKFQSTPSREGDVLEVGLYGGACLVSIHALARGRPVLVAIRSLLWVFQSTPSREGDLDFQNLCLRRSAFQSTPSREGDIGDVLSCASGMSVSIHALARGRPVVQRVEVFGIAVSIHALARGRPAPGAQSPVLWNVSIHALARGRPLFCLHAFSVKMFQSTPSREGDPRSKPSGVGVSEVSIHALARGRPPTADLLTRPATCFNPRPRARATGGAS